MSLCKIKPLHDIRSHQNIFDVKPGQFSRQAGQFSEFHSIFKHLLKTPRQAVCYCAGFPCQPYSRLNAHSALLRDPKAQPFFQVVRHIRVVAPPVSRTEMIWNALKGHDMKCLCLMEMVNLLCPIFVLQLRWRYWRMCWDSNRCWTRCWLISKRASLGTLVQLRFPLAKLSCGLSMSDWMSYPWNQVWSPCSSAQPVHWSAKWDISSWWQSCIYALKYKNPQSSSLLLSGMKLELHYPGTACTSCCWEVSSWQRRPKEILEHLLRDW